MLYRNLCRNSLESSRSSRWIALAFCSSVFGVACGSGSKGPPSSVANVANGGASGADGGSVQDGGVSGSANGGGNGVTDGGPGSGKALIGPNGGEFESADGVMEVIVPAGALAGALAMTIDAATSPLAGAVGQVYEIGPTGTTFAVPITVVVHYAADDLGAATPQNVAVSTVVGDQWQNLTGAALDVSHQTIAGLTYHLSPYSLALIKPGVPLPYPQCQWDILQGDFCPSGTNTGDKCAYADQAGNLVEAYCDGTNYETASAPAGCPAAQPSGTCGYFARTCQYLEGNTSPNGCAATCDCVDGTWNCHDDCTCMTVASGETVYGSGQASGTKPFGTFCATGTTATCLETGSFFSSGADGTGGAAGVLLATTTTTCNCVANAWQCACSSTMPGYCQ